MATIKFGIVMATYKRKNDKSPMYLKRSIKSIIDQQYTNWSLIIVSDKYEDENELSQIINEFNNDKIILLHNYNVERDFIKNKNNLWYVAGATSMNLGLNYLRDNDYKYYCHLDDDDYWSNNHLEQIYNIFNNYKNCIFVNTQSTYNNSVLPNHIIDIYANNMLPTPCGMIHSSISFRCDILKINYKTTFNEHEATYPSDANMLIDSRQFLLDNKEYCSIYIPTLSCFHDIEGEKSY